MLTGKINNYEQLKLGSILWNFWNYMTNVSKEAVFISHNMLSEISQTEKNKYWKILLIYGISGKAHKLCENIHKYEYTCISIYMYIYIYTWIYMYIYTFIGILRLLFPKLINFPKLTNIFPSAQIFRSLVKAKENRHSEVVTC